LYLLLQYHFNVFGGVRLLKNSECKTYATPLMKIPVLQEILWGTLLTYRGLYRNILAKILPCNLKLATLHFNLIHMKLKRKNNILIFLLSTRHLIKFTSSLANIQKKTHSSGSEQIFKTANHIGYYLYAIVFYLNLLRFFTVLNLFHSRD